jgi:hypothetical protein
VVVNTTLFCNLPFSMAFTGSALSAHLAANIHQVVGVRLQAPQQRSALQKQAPGINDLTKKC